jgi:hypothetical protein
VIESREIAPHPVASTKAKYGYVSMEMKQTSSAATTRKETGEGANIAAPSNSAAASPALMKTSVARFDFVLLHRCMKLLDGTFILSQHSVPEEEINAPKKWTKGCIRAIMGSGATPQQPPAHTTPPRSQPLPPPCAGWVLRPFYVDGTTAHVQVWYISCVRFPARVGSWIPQEFAQRAFHTLGQLRLRLKAIMQSHPLEKIEGGSVHHRADGKTALHVSARTRDHTLHIRGSQTVSPSMVHAVSSHGVQTQPHPKAKS